MKPEQIIKMARSTGVDVCDADDFYESTGVHIDQGKVDALEKFAAAVAAAEREACAQLAAETVCDVHLPTGVKIYGTRAAEAIRARGEQ